jgi:hypothetical protein
MQLTDSKNALLPQNRVHVTAAYDWGQRAGTDYWLVNNSVFDIYAAAATTVSEQLAENGWTATSLVNTAGSGADFQGGVFTTVGASGPGARSIDPAGTFADAGTPNHALTNASGDLLGSPAIFGDAAHGRMAAQLVGRSKMPQYLIMEFWSAFTVANTASEPSTAVGFYIATATISTEAHQLAVIQSDGTNFVLAGAAAKMATGPLIDTNWHLWKIALQFNGATGANVFAWQDGTLFSTTAGVAAQDVFPAKIGFHALTTNRIGLGLTHVYYDW